MEYQAHLETCWARASVTSTDYSSDSPDVEVLSDTGEFHNAETFSLPPSKGKGAMKISPTKPHERLPNGQPRQRVTSGSSSDDRFVKNSGADTLKYNPSGYDSSTDSYFSMFASGGGNGLELDSDSESESDEEAMEYTAGEMARLLSLNEQDMLDSSDSPSDDDNEEPVTGGGGVEGHLNSPHRSKAAQQARRSHASPAGSSGSSKPTTSTHKVRLEPVGVFWDIENCPVPVDKSAFGVAAKMRQEFISGKREAEFMCVCDITKERKEVTDELHKAQVSFGAGHFEGHCSELFCPILRG